MRIALACAACASALLAGCAGPTPYVQCKVGDAPPGVTIHHGAAGSAMLASMPGANQVIMIPPVDRAIAITGAQLDRSPTGNALLRLEVANCTGQTLVVRTRTQFLDARGQRSEAPTAWREFILAPRSVGSHDELGTQPGSVAFRTEFDQVQAR